MSDWMSSEPTSGDMTGTGFLFWTAKTASKIAKLLGNVLAETRFSVLAEETKVAFNENFLNTSTGMYSYTDDQPEPGYLLGLYAKIGMYSNQQAQQRAWRHINNVTGLHGSAVAGAMRIVTDTQCGQSMPIALGITPAAQVPAAVDVLVKNVERNRMHHMGGMFSTKWTLDVLSRHGHMKEALATQLQTTQPSFGYMLLNNASTIWESWFFSNRAKATALPCI